MNIQLRDAHNEESCTQKTHSSACACACVVAASSPGRLQDTAPGLLQDGSSSLALRFGSRRSRHKLHVLLAAAHDATCLPQALKVSAPATRHARCTRGAPAHSPHKGMPRVRHSFDFIFTLVRTAAPGQLQRLRTENRRVHFIILYLFCTQEHSRGYPYRTRTAGNCSAFTEMFYCFRASLFENLN